MNFSRHCTLCENEISNLERGLTCKLTNRKPEFKEACPDIRLTQKFQNKLEEANLELKIIGRKKKSVHPSFYFLIIIGFIVIIGSSFIADWTHAGVFFWYEKIALIGLGVTLLMIAYQKLNRFRNQIKAAASEKNKIDLVLEKYGISYKTTFEFKEIVHGTQEVTVNIEFKNWTKQRTRTTHIINY